MNCPEHPSWEATHMADSYFKGKPPVPICSICYANLFDYPHTRDIWVWKIGEDNKKFLSGGSK